MPQRSNRRVLEVGAEVARFPARKMGPNPYLKVEYELATFPVLNERLSLEEWLTKTRSFIASLLLEFAEPPNELFAIGVPIPVRA